MRCPFCKEDNDKVIDSRSSDEGRTIRRRRQCLACHRRFTTYEKTGDGIRLSVVKTDGSRVPYERETVVLGLQEACTKRPVAAEQLQHIVDRTEEHLFRRFDKEVSSKVIADLVCKYLRAVDRIAYIRYLSMVRDFQTAEQLLEEVEQTLAQAEPIDQLHLFEP